MLRSYLAIGPVVARPASNGSRRYTSDHGFLVPPSETGGAWRPPFRSAPFAGRGGVSATGRIGTAKCLDYFMFSS